MLDRFVAAARAWLNIYRNLTRFAMPLNLLINHYGAIQADASTDHTARDAVAVPVFHTRQLSHDCPPIIHPRAS